MGKASGDSRKRECEGGCGVLGFASSEPIAGRHLMTPCERMHNRGNGKGGGIAVVGCFPDHKDLHALQIGYLRPDSRRDVEERFVRSVFHVEDVVQQPRVDDVREVPGLGVAPPDVWRYFVRPTERALHAFMREEEVFDADEAAERLVYRNSYRLNVACYAEAAEKGAFVLSHGKNMMVLKAVGYAEDVLRYYRLEEMTGHVWIGHQRYPTRGRVWHPGGAHPFVGLHQALVHNGDFANYHAVREYLAARGIRPLFLTDTEVAALLFDYYDRILGYPLEHVIEAIAPTTERDFELLSKRRQRLYRAIRAAHVHGSPDGPWFFIIARSLPDEDRFQLIGITDTSMLRPHVFSISEGPIRIACVASEKQAIDAFLAGLSAVDPRVSPVADMYWSSRGGSHTDGGAYVFSVEPTEPDGRRRLVCTDKFGVLTSGPAPGSANPDPAWLRSRPELPEGFAAKLEFDDTRTAAELFDWFLSDIATGSYDDVAAFADALAREGERGDGRRDRSLETLTLMRDRHYRIDGKKRNWILARIDRAIAAMLDACPPLGSAAPDRYRRVALPDAGKKLLTHATDAVLAVDATGFPAEGERSVSQLIVRAHRGGFKRFLVYRLRGDRFIGCGMGPRSDGVRIDCYGSTGDYVGSGLDGAEIYVHGSAQDQAGQILNRGKLVIFGDVGQTFLYGAKGGVAYVFGNTGGRPLINSVGRIRAIINGTCLDYAAESFMAGAELGGGFLMINGLRVNVHGEFLGIDERFPGSNFFGLASGGAGYINDPYRRVTEDQLNGAGFAEFTQADWEIVHHYLQENERLFGISIERDILTVDRTRKWPTEVYRKVVAKQAAGVAVAHA
jgi:glutamate synthase domain-containing protein 1/glutamate synthase domain-containing protein 3